jgi:hypothetical protein
MRCCALLLIALSLFGSSEVNGAEAQTVDLSQAVVLTPPGLKGAERKAVEMLVSEIRKRTQLELPVVEAWPDGNRPVIAVGQVAKSAALGGRFAEALGKRPLPPGAEGYSLSVLRDERGPAVFVVGADTRGALFGVGRLLRALRMTPGKLELSPDLQIATAPAYPLRGHQLGYRPKTNSYDAWDLDRWEQYYRDLIVFGTNAIELLPPRTDDDADSPHFPLPPLEMMIGMSRLADDYDLDVWLWFPAMDDDYGNPATVEAALVEWDAVFRQLPRVDAVFVPGGDPGHTQPKHLLALLEKQSAVLHRSHPNAEMWVSPQGFSQAWLEEFLEILKRDEPAWLTGVVFGPQVRVSLPELRAAVPKKYPIRHYPDITHSRQCQYPVPDWDVAHAVTSGRECINPRPLGQAAIFRALQPHTMGFLTYSEGCNDDVNKFIWSGLGWNPDTPVLEILRDYAGYFIGDAYRDEFAQGLLALERNWQKPLLTNTSVDTALAQFRDMERNATPELLANWRFQQALYRAYYDAYVRQRLVHETEVERQALDVLQRADGLGALKAAKQAEEILAAGEAVQPAADLRDRVVQLADTLHASIGMQLSVHRHKAIGVGRGATLDNVDYPLNNARWLRQELAAIPKLADEAARRAKIRELVDWTNPGPGGFYDDLGNVSSQPHLVAGEPFERDPAFLASPHAGFAGPETGREGSAAWRTSWLDHAESLNDAPLFLRYTGLDPAARYKVRVVYAGDGPAKKIRLDTGDGREVHPFITKPAPVAPAEFAIPQESIKAGTLELQWRREPGLGDNGRGCQVAEVWLIKK